MDRIRPVRLQHIASINVDRMGAIGDAAEAKDLLRLENLDCNIPPDEIAVTVTQNATSQDSANSYLPFIGQSHLRNVVATHISLLSGAQYSGDKNVLITAGGLSGILNVLLATVDVGDEVILTDPTYAGLINRVRLAGGVPKYIPFNFQPGAEWTLDVEALRASITPRTRVLLFMSPALPTGAYINKSDWMVISSVCIQHRLLLILDAAMERLLFDKREYIHPASFPGMSSRTITVGSCSKELRMIGWRVGWVVAPEDLIPDLTAVCLANVVVPVGIAQEAVAHALEISRAPQGMDGYLGELQSRRDLILEELAGLPVGIPAGGWSLLLKVDGYGFDGEGVVPKLFEKGICATGMKGWGAPNGDTHNFVRIVFSNESTERLKGLGWKVREALGIE